MIPLLTRRSVAPVQPRMKTSSPTARPRESPGGATGVSRIGSESTARPLSWSWATISAGAVRPPGSVASIRRPPITT